MGRTDLRAWSSTAAWGGALIVTATLLAGCDEKLRDLTGPTPDLKPTFSSIQQQIFSSSDSSGRPACTNCHTNVGRTPAGGLNLLPDLSYASLVGIASRGKPDAIRVIPGDPDNSYLVHKLEGHADIVGLRMPRNSTVFLTDGQMLVIRRWIQLGAQND
jgi:hypothetical protein